MLLDSQACATPSGSGVRVAFRWRALAAALILLVGPALRAQDVPVEAGGRSEIFVNGELERYLRYLQSEGLVALYPWSIRDFSPRETDALAPRTTTHPWASRYDFARRPGSSSFDFDVVHPTVAVSFNSAFPFGSNDGPVWAGRGLTTSLQMGAAVRWHFISLKIAPMVFRAENRPFALMPNGETGTRVFSDGPNPNGVDRPQRFGNTPYTVFDPGESSLRLDTKLLSLGISSADQGWGPADRYPFLLGNNAAGFPHVFIGSGEPLNLWLVRLHGRLVYGQLAQTAYSSMKPDSSGAKRLMSGAVALIEVRGVPGLELGAARFFHSAWPDSGLSWSDFRVPLEPVGKKSLVDATGVEDDVRNQLASIFFRWVLPRSGFEVYGELGKEDHNWDMRDIILDPDHAATHMFGLRKVWSPTPTRMIAVRAEMIDLRFNPLTRERPIGGGYYVHAKLQQGHTERGQLLGADIPGGSGSGASVALEGFTGRGRWTIEWRRTVSDTAGDYSLTGVLPAKNPDVQHSLGADMLLFRGPMDLHVGVTGVYDINRYFARDEFNFNAIVSSRWSW